MELYCVRQQHDLNSSTTSWTKNLREGTSTFDIGRCQQPAKHCNGYSPHLFEDKGNMCLNGAPSSPTNTPELFTDRVNSPSHCVPLFNSHGKNHKLVALGNGLVDYDRISCNGFHHQTVAYEMSPEKTVGHGRPRSRSDQEGVMGSHPKRMHSWSGPVSENEDRFNHGSQYIMTPEKLRQSYDVVMEMQRQAFNNQETEHGFDSLEMSNHVENPCLQMDRHPSLEVYFGSKKGITDTIPRRRSAEYHVKYPSSHSASHTKNSVPLKPKVHFAIQGTPARSRCENEALSIHESNSSLNGWHHVSEVPLEDETKEDLQQKILYVLTTYGAMEALDIVKAVGRGTRNEVNQSLFSLHNRGLVSVVRTSDGSSTVWNLTGQLGLDRRASPGVIGGERNNEKSFGRSNHEEFHVHLWGHSSAGAYDNRPKKQSCAVDGVKPWMRSNSHGPSSDERNAWFYCKLCRVSLVSEAQYEEHLRSTKHQNKVAKFSAIPYKKFCECCKVHLNSESQAKEHFSSGRHEQTMAKSQKAPPQQHLPLITAPEEFIPQRSTNTQPYDYQLELYSKAMKTNSVCFLPTGTGKTLVASLIIGHMLRLNPSRQVVFLVDRVLLVLQQSDYLRKELAHMRVADERGSFKGTRPIRIGAVCGEMRKLEGNARIYEQDVLIITADCYRNHLNNGTLRFDDVSLIVLDEAHHCNKDHPYNVIIRDFYLREDALLGHRPKILGLTESPAGEISLDKTTKRLQRLLGNLDEANLLVVTRNVQELEEKTNRAPPDCILASYTSSEHELMEVLVEYITKAFNMAVRLSEMKDYKDIFQPSSGGLFSIDDIHPVLGVIDNILLSHPEANALCSLLHFQRICEAVCTLQECGEQIAFYQMAELGNDKCPHGFHWAESVALPCSKVRSYLDHYLTKEACHAWPPELSVPNSGADQLIKRLLNINWTGTSGRDNCLVLVLVKRPRTARYLAEYLSNCEELLLRRVETTFIVGHESESADEGMSFPTQGEVISKIREGYYQIVVTSSLAEEGLDLPMSNMVIQMDPSNSVLALAQIRGRAPLNEARFVAICRNDEQAKKIDDLLRREENMKRSARLINGL